LSEHEQAQIARHINLERESAESSRNCQHVDAMMEEMMAVETSVARAQAAMAQRLARLQHKACDRGDAKSQQAVVLSGQVTVFPSLCLTISCILPCHADLFYLFHKVELLQRELQQKEQALQEESAALDVVRTEWRLMSEQLQSVQMCAEMLGRELKEKQEENAFLHSEKVEAQQRQVLGSTGGGGHTGLETK
jgi:hypothetical protein